MNPADLDKDAPTITAKLDGRARAVVDSYLALPIGAKPSCPYFNNRRRGSKSQLRVLRGKGSPQEIAEEATINALHARVDIASLSTDKLKEFIISQDLGIDCSGFAYHVLDAYCREYRGRSLASFIASNRDGFFGKIAAKLRPAENMGVSTFTHDKNSVEIDASQAQPGDFISLIGTGKDGTYNHMMVVTGVDRTNGDTRITYAHSYAWPADGLSGHGVREGDVLVHGAGSSADLLAGTWKEKNELGSSNYTFESARAAKSVSVRRLRFLTK